MADLRQIEIKGDDGAIYLTYSKEFVRLKIETDRDSVELDALGIDRLARWIKDVWHG